jgi:hypothetical protein
MADTKPQVKFNTPRGPFIYPKLNKPDTKFNAAGEYRVKVRLNPSDIPQDLTDKLTELRDERANEVRKELTAKKQGAKLKSLKVLDLFRDETDKDTGESTGFVTISAKMKASGVGKKDGKPWTRKPNLFDAAGKPLRTSKLIWGGSEGKVAITAMPYYMAKDNEVGVAYYLEAVQILKLVSGSDKDAAGYGFGEEEGYTGDDEEEASSDAPTSETDGTGADAPSGGKGDDF